MYRPVTQSRLGMALAVVLMLTTSLAAQETATDPWTHNMSAEAMMVDTFLLRPAGLVGMVLGTVTFIVSLPFSLPTGMAHVAGQKLVVEPAQYTFARPLGFVQDWNVRDVQPLPPPPPPPAR
jgi:hypothetical protein